MPDMLKPVYPPKTPFCRGGGGGGGGVIIIFFSASNFFMHTFIMFVTYLPRAEKIQ